MARKKTNPDESTWRPQNGPQRIFLENKADICIFGGAAGGGKTWALLLDAVRWVSPDPRYGKWNVGDFSAVLFRKTSPQITAAGGLWTESMKLYPHRDGRPREHVHEWKFPSGAVISMRHLQHDKDRLAWQGSQIPWIGFDELTHFSADQFWYLLSRSRSTCGVRPYVRATTNADADSWVAELLVWWIDPETGYPIPDRAGRLRWFVRINDRLEWADYPDQLRGLYPDIPPKSLSFVPAKLSDNAILMAADPGYLHNLLALPLVERERLLGGNWKIRPAAGLVFNRVWFQIVETLPAHGITWVRAWDKAATTKDTSDWTAGVKIGRHTSGVFYVADVVRGRWGSHERDQIIKQTAQLDGPGVAIEIEEEGGSGGKQSAEISVRDLCGWDVRTQRVTGDKLTRARPLAAQAGGGNVRLLKGHWNAAFLDELHAFPESKFDDQVDATSLGFNKLANVYTGEWVYKPSEAARTEFDRMPPDVWDT